VNRSRPEIGTWCFAGAIVGWLVGVFAFLGYFSVDPRQAFLQMHPLNSPVTPVSTLGGTVLLGWYAIHGIRDRGRRIVFGSVVGGWLGAASIPALSHRNILLRLLDEPLYMQGVMVIPVFLTAAGAALASSRERPSRLTGSRYRAVMVYAVAAGAFVGSTVGHVGAAFSAGIFVAAITALILD